MVRAARTAVWFATLSVLVACGGSGDLSKAVDLTEKDSGSSIDVHVTDELTVRLESNPSTGYHWELTAEPDGKVLAVVGSQYEAPAGGAPGAPGIEVWWLRAVGAGTTGFTLDYIGPDGTTVGKTFLLSVSVQ